MSTPSWRTSLVVQGHHPDRDESGTVLLGSGWCAGWCWRLSLLWPDGETGALPAGAWHRLVAELKEPRRYAVCLAVFGAVACGGGYR
jgi:hypothetical protein